MKKLAELKRALKTADRLSDACQAAYARGDSETGKRLESEADAAAKIYADLCDASPALLAGTGEE